MTKTHTSKQKEMQEKVNALEKKIERANQDKDSEV